MVAVLILYFVFFECLLYSRVTLVIQYIILSALKVSRVWNGLFLYALYLRNRKAKLQRCARILSLPGIHIPLILPTIGRYP